MDWIFCNLTISVFFRVSHPSGHASFSAYCMVYLLVSFCCIPLMYTCSYRRLLGDHFMFPDVNVERLDTGNWLSARY